MHQWIDVFEKSDYRFILIEYDEDVSIEELIPFFDILIQEYEELGGGDEYSFNLAKLDGKLWKGYLIRAIQLTIMALRFGMKEDAQLLIDDFNLKVKINDKKLIDNDAIKKLERRIKQIESALKVNEIEEAEEIGKSKKVVWEDLMSDIHIITGASIPYDCPVKSYLSYKKTADRMIAAKNKQNEK